MIPTARAGHQQGRSHATAMSIHENVTLVHQEGSRLITMTNIRSGYCAAPIVAISGGGDLSGGGGLSVRVKQNLTDVLDCYHSCYYADSPTQLVCKLGAGS